MYHRPTGGIFIPPTEGMTFDEQDPINYDQFQQGDQRKK